jgi:hypothetical protein
MAREYKTVVRSDLSGDEIPEDEAVTITIRFADRSRNKVELDATESEVQDLLQRGREVRRRPRRGRSTKSEAE